MVHGLWSIVLGQHGESSSGVSPLNEQSRDGSATSAVPKTLSRTLSLTLSKNEDEDENENERSKPVLRSLRPLLLQARNYKDG